MGGQNSASVSTATNIDTIQTLDNQVVKSTKTAKSTKEKKELRLSNTYRSRTLLNSEVLTIKDNGIKIDGKAGIFAFTKSLKNGNQAGLIVSYRSTKSKDRYKSKTITLSFVPLYRIEKRINDKLSMPIVLNAIGNLVYLKSSIFSSGAGYLEYGAGVGVVPKYKINDKFSVTGNLTYQYVKKYIPSSQVPDDAKWIADAINNLKPLQTLAYGVGAQYQIKSNLGIGVNILQTKQLETSEVKDGRDTATYYSTTLSYDYKKWTFGAGYKLVEDLKDYKEHAYMLSFGYKW
jgi:hypothetical protein